MGEKDEDYSWALDVEGDNLERGNLLIIPS